MVIAVSSLNRKQIFDYTLEAEERKSDDGSRNQRDRYTLEALGGGTVFDSRADTCKKHHCKEEAESDSERGDHGLCEAVLCGDVVKGNAENGAVGGNKRQVNAERLVQSGNEFLQYDLNELNERRNNKYEHYGLKIFVVGRKDIVESLL